jgi:hypothetical protein
LNVLAPAGPLEATERQREGKKIRLIVEDPKQIEIVKKKD